MCYNLHMQIKNSIYSGIIAGALVVAGFASFAQAGPNCTCRYAGQNFKTGAVMCIRGKLSKCDFVLNNTSWKIIAETCPQVLLAPNLNKNQSVGVPQLPKSGLMVKLRTRL